MKKLINTVKISCSIIGAVIGAGFITGREIIRFFYGTNILISVSILFLSLFCLVYLILRLKNTKLLFICEKSNYFIYGLNLLIMASMLGATDSLAESLFNIPKNVPVFSIAILLLSTFCCFGGIDKLANISLIIIPFMLLIFFSAILFLPKENLSIDFNSASGVDYITYGSMNIFLAQPFLLKIKKEKNEFSPFGVALISAIVLSLAIVAFLSVLSEEYIFCDIPLILLVKNSKLFYYLISAVIFASIFTTLTSVQYPFLGIINEKVGIICFIVASVGAFAISRMGFFVIVDKIYPIVAIISFVYYLVFIAIWLYIFQAGQRRHTLNRQEGLKLRC